MTLSTPVHWTCRKLKESHTNFNPCEDNEVWFEKRGKVVAAIKRPRNREKSCEIWKYVRQVLLSWSKFDRNHALILTVAATSKIYHNLWPISKVAITSTLRRGTVEILDQFSTSQQYHCGVKYWYVWLIDLLNSFIRFMLCNFKVIVLHMFLTGCE